MGTVYRATHIVLDHMVALKVIAPDLADDDSFRERFKSESRIAVSLRHPNVVPIHHAGEEQGLLFVTMDLIDGPDLRKLLTARGPLEPAEAISILEQVAAALDVAHSRGLVHRDIKPGNILIEARTGVDHAYLTDFGLTKRMDQATEVSALTSTGAFVGTLDYVAPEQIRGERLDARTDVYALGCVLYEMLAAAAPFAEREEKVAKIYAHLQDVPTPLEGRAAALNDVITRALSKEPDDRYPSAGDLARAADAALAGGRVAEAERSVATGPAAPTMAYETPGPGPTEPAIPIEAAAESKLPPVSDPEPAANSETSEAPTVLPGTPTVESKIAAGEASAPPPTLAEPRSEPAATAAETAATPPPPSRHSGRRRGLLRLAGGALLVAAIAGAAVLILGSGSDPSTTDPKGSGGAGGGGASSDPVARVQGGGVPGGKLPVGVAVAGNRVFTADRTGGQVLLGNASTREGIRSVSTRENPEDLIVESGALWVTVPKANSVIRMETDLSNPQEIQVGTDPNGIAAADGSIFVTNFEEGDVSRIDSANPSIEAERIEIEATNPHGIAVADGVLWVTDRAENELIRYDLGTGERRSVGVGLNPKGVAVSDGVVWVANADEGTVSLIGEADLEPIGEAVEVGGQPRAVDVFDGKVWVSNGDDESKELGAKDGWVSVFDATTQKLIEKKLVVGGSPEGLGVGEGRVWVATGPEGTVRAIKPG